METYDRTAFIHLHSLVSQYVLLPCFEPSINILQHLLSQIVLATEIASHFHRRNLRTDSVENIDLSEQDVMDHEQLQVHKSEVVKTFAELRQRSGDRKLESTFWAWLHVLLRTEREWKESLGQEIWSLNASLAIMSDPSTRSLSKKGILQVRHSRWQYYVKPLMQRVEDRKGDLIALRRVVMFATEALRLTSTSILPTYLAFDETYSIAPPSYYSVQGNVESEESCDDIELGAKLVYDKAVDSRQRSGSEPAERIGPGTCRTEFFALPNKRLSNGQIQRQSQRRRLHYYDGEDGLKLIKRLTCDQHTIQAEDSCQQKSYNLDSQGSTPLSSFSAHLLKSQLESLLDSFPSSPARETNDTRPRSNTLDSVPPRGGGMNQEETWSLSYQTEFESWLLCDPIYHLYVNHPLEIRHWSFQRSCHSPFDVVIPLVPSDIQ